MIHRQYQGLLLPEIQESSVQFDMIGVLRVKTKAYSFQSLFKLKIKRFLTPMFVIYITLCMLDKFSYYVIFVMYIFNIKKILGASPVRLFGRD